MEPVHVFHINVLFGKDQLLMVGTAYYFDKDF